MEQNVTISSAASSMGESRSYDAWLVDLDGTLYRQTPVRWLMAGELLLMGPHRLRAIACFRREQERMRHEACSGEGEASPYERHLARSAAALGCSSEALAATVRYWMEQRPAKWLRLFRRRGLLREIAEFRAGGGRTAVVSDYPATIKLAGMQIASLFEVVVASGEAGGPSALKPDPAGYLLAAQRLQVEPARCLVLGDRTDADGEAARRAGMAFRLVR
jgi:HAD superfamily hydrolase (TIGR01549 family)